MFRNRILHVALSVCLALSLPVCAGSGSSSGLGPAPAVGGDLSALSDGRAPTDWDRGGRPGTSDSATGSGSGDGSGQGSDFEACPEPRGILCPCKSNEDCESGWCVEGPDGLVCTEACIDACPPRFACKQITGVEGDLIFLCIYPYGRLCRPCTADSDCVGGGGSLSDRCVDGAGHGQFCGAGCTETLPCPEGFACADVTTVTGEPAKQCVPGGGICPCTEDLDGQSMVCDPRPLGFRCPGTMTCSEGSWSDCSTLKPPTESCDGVDNDCDGDVDEDFGEQTCGLGECRKTVPICDNGTVITCAEVEMKPEAEVCDGKDNDCDNSTDEDLGEISCGLGECAQTYDACVEGILSECDPFKGKAVEACDGKDNDCDGLVDQHWPEVGGACDGTDADLCEGGVWQCRDDGLGVVCAGDDTPQVEMCNGEDDDCDGEIDEDLGETTCGLGECKTTIHNCVEGELTDCESVAAAKKQDTDLPDQGREDTNCDGIDGELDNAVFVDEQGGDDDNAGNADAPLRTIAAGIAKAAELGLRDVYVSTGFYAESLVLQNGVSVYGLYSAADDWTRHPGNRVTVSGGTTAVLAEDITETTVLDGLLIESADTKVAGASTYVIRAKDSPGLHVRDCVLFAGRGADGRDGKDGETGADGLPGGQGGTGCEYGCMSTCTGLDIAYCLLFPDDCPICALCCADLVENPLNCNKVNCDRPQGGDGGGNRECEADGGKGGKGGLSHASGERGADSPSGAAGGAPGTKTKNGVVGAAGTSGDDGDDGSAGRGGVFAETGFEGSHGDAGAEGDAGSGGGGGGGGGGDAPGCNDLSACTTYGSGGGGGGAGGCGGGSGGGGMSGGGSFGVYLWASNATLEDLQIVTAGGGDGGAGGAGKKGGLGADGGPGGSKGDAGEDNGTGGRGGAGGEGGGGGHGGGGAGGPSVGVYCGAESRPFVDDISTSELGPAGQGGESDGNAGVSGAQAGTLDCE